jgi:hypothetical protein
MNPKITPDHVSRAAVVYVRQSTMAQVTGNLESRGRPRSFRGPTPSVAQQQIEIVEQLVAYLEAAARRAQPKDELADLKTSEPDRDWDNAISSCGPIVPPCAARAVARAWTRSGTLRIGTRGALSNHSGPTPSRRAPRHRRPYRALADGVRAAAKAKGQAWRLHPAVAHARPAGGGRLTLWRVGPHAAPHSVTISPRSDSAGRRFSSARRNHRSASAA